MSVEERRVNRWARTPDSIGAERDAAETARGEVVQKGAAARPAAKELGAWSSEQKNTALRAMAGALVERAGEILKENRSDLEDARRAGVTGPLMDRLSLSEQRISAVSEGMRNVADLADPVGRIREGRRLYNGLQVEKRGVPLGVVGVIYEARPNVAADAAALCLKSGNAVILRGGSEARRSNSAVVDVLVEAGRRLGLPNAAIQLLETPGRSSSQALMRARGLVDVLVPRGGNGLIQTVVREAEVPVIETGVGNCHVYVDRDAELESAAEIVVNAKTRRPAVCNAMETLLVHRDVAEPFLERVAPLLTERGVELRGCAETRRIRPEIEGATEEDWAAEYLGLVLAIRVVADLHDALDHIDSYGTGHSEAIVTENYRSGETFLNLVDAAAVYVNASTCFTDGNEFGLGAEIGISTQKLHARGPLGLEALTTTKYVVRGGGQVRA